MIKLNGVEIKPTIFPDKTSQVWKVPNLDAALFHIDFDFEHEGEIFHLIQLVYLIRASCVHISPVIGLRMNYFPYARQDKNVSNTSTFALHPFLELLGHLGFSYVETIDVHNQDAIRDIPFLINLKNYTTEQEIRDTIAVCGSDTILFPDLGALNRYKNYQLGSSIQKIAAHKVRDQQTGELLRYVLIGVNDSDNLGNVLIVDDLCDGGGTFILAAAALREFSSVKNIDLFTSHGIYSKGISHLKENGINRVFNHKGEV